jgi:hypothetical protein
MNKKNVEIVSKLLNDFSIYLDNRSIDFIVSDKFLPQIFKWHFNVWKIEQNITKHRVHAIYKVKNSLDSIFRKIEERVLREGNSRSFFDSFKKHIEAHRGNHSYIESLFEAFYEIFFENIYNSPEKNSIWESYFPADWKITLNNLGERNSISHITKKIFINWAKKRVQSAIFRENVENDRHMDNVSWNLFPEVDPRIWAAILFFEFSPYDVTNRCQSVIESPWNFGLYGRTVVADSEKELQAKIDECVQKTCKLALNMFSRTFTKQKLEKYIDELNKLQYPPESEQERKQKKLRQIFEYMLKLSGSAQRDKRSTEDEH